MFTNNYKRLCDARFFSSNKSIKLYNGSNVSASPSALLYADIGYRIYAAKYIDTLTPESTSADTYAGVAFGTGTTPASAEDYTLENQVPSGSLSFTNSSTYTTTEDEDGRWNISATFVVKNNTESDIAISEIGYFGSIQYGQTSTYSPKYVPCLMERTVLAEPITIPAGQAKVITYKVSGVLSLS